MDEAKLLSREHLDEEPRFFSVEIGKMPGPEKRQGPAHGTVKGNGAEDVPTAGVWQKPVTPKVDRKFAGGHHICSLFVPSSQLNLLA